MSGVAHLAALIQLGHPDRCGVSTGGGASTDEYTRPLVPVVNLRHRYLDLGVSVTDRFNCNPLGSDLIGPNFKTDQGIGPKRLCNGDVSSVTSLSNQYT